MRANMVPQTWRLVELDDASRRCPYCGEQHHYLTHPPLCRPVLFPPGVPAATGTGVEVDAFIEGAAAHRGDTQEAALYRVVARRVAEGAIRCEACGERFDSLDGYLMHDCTIHYR